ncbi:MAG: thiamine diphosphokinase [Chloroflexi bacterium RBG_16_56_8]|nr:MAG: thiamine diphosphokinase [Chloroflexi bacterium RBG_16_56_8]
MPRAVIFANGHLPDPDKARLLLRPKDHIVCADGGLQHARALGLQPHAVIGDLDSLSKEEISQLTHGDMQLHLFPPEKNETDLELALNYVVESGFDEILVVAALGGRLDQTLSNLSLLTDARYSTLDIRLDDGIEAAFFCRDQAQVQGRSGDLVSLIPWGGPVAGVRTQGLKYPLRDEALYPEKSRGISNEMLDDTASVRILSGLLLIVHRRLSADC